MAKLDYSKHDLQVTITADPRRGLWASSLLNHGMAIRKGGQLPTESHAHTLLLVALTNTLRGVTRGEYEKLQHMKAVVKPRVKVIVSGRGIVNTFAGTTIAWLLVREKFVLNPIIGGLVDLPFALPTVIAGLTLITVYGPGSPVGLNIVYTRWVLLIALAFVTLPFSVRSVQPVLEALDIEAEEAAASLGASGFMTFRKIILPSLMPAILTGAGLGFARAIGEFGSVVLVSGDLPFKTEVATVRIYGLIESDNLPAAAAISLVLFLVAIGVLAIFAALRRRFIPAEGA